MQKLQIEKSDAVKLFKSAPEYFKKVLIATFGDKCFNGNIIDRINSFEDALEEKGKRPEEIFRASDPRHRIAQDKIEFIISVINEDFKPDFSNSNQNKWCPFFKWSGSGFVFTHSYYYYDYSAAGTGARLCCETEAKSNHMGQQFIELYNDFLK